MDIDHRRLGIDLFNHTWQFLEKPELTAEEDEAMIHAAYASRYTGAEPAVHHARKCLEWCERGGVEDWDIAFAHEALARAYKLAGNAADAERYKRLAREAGDAIADPGDREHFGEDWATL